jgi:UDP-N-acetylglucosamine--dolichyl-phosphate N-acetylglucosaminephosphotransferase
MAIAATTVLVFTVPLELADGSGVVLTALLGMSIVFALTPPLIRKMKAGDMVGLDVNKPFKTEVAELGGIAALFAFSISLSFVVGLQKLLGNIAEPPFLAAISVFFMASMIGLIDDISDLRQRLKAVAVAIAALPLMLVHLGAPVIDFPFGLRLDLSGSLHLFYWLVLVPIGVTGVANAMNISAGYNGLETGQIAVISISLLVVAQLQGASDVSLLVFGALFGCAAGLYYFNRYPAKVFVGDIGTLGLGAALAAGVILAHVEFYGLIAIAPAFYEAAATAYYGLHEKNGIRKSACANPVINGDRTLQPPSGAGRYTLAYWLLSKKPMTEPQLVRAILGLYALSGTVAVVLSVL